MNRQRRRLLAAGAALTLAPSLALAKRRWVKLGDRVVAFTTENDSIHVGLRGGLFTTLRFKVEEGAIVLRDLRIVFGSGDDHRPQVDLVLNESSRARVIDIPGPARVIRQVDFRYRSLLLGGERAVVSLWGEKR